MRIVLTGTTNSDKLFLNGICLVRKEEGKTAVSTVSFLDRDESEWKKEGEEVSVTFRHPYIWDGENVIYDTEKILSAVMNADGFFEEYEEDAEDGYELVLTAMTVVDDNGSMYFLERWKELSKRESGISETRKDAEEVVNNMSPTLAEEIYRVLRKEHVVIDALAFITDDYNYKKKLSDYSERQQDIADAIAERLVYDGDYDRNLSYWDNIKALYDDITTSDMEPDEVPA